MSTPTAASTPVPAASASASAPRSARERVREEMTAEILAVAGQHVARDGAAALSLRSIARDLGMAPSALYRYFDGRDALLSALILGAYEALASEAERAADRAERDVPPATAGDAARWVAVPRALRGWALAHPHQWGLIFGTPVPGYQAPEDTVEPYARRGGGPRPPAGGGAGGGPARSGRRDAARVGGAACGRGTRERRAAAEPAGREGGAGAPGLDDDRRHHQPGGVRPLAQHGARTGPALRGRSSPSSPRRSACTERSRRVGYAAGRHRRRRLQRKASRSTWARTCSSSRRSSGTHSDMRRHEVEDQRSELGELLAWLLQLDL